MKLGDAIKAWRLLLDLSQEELADRAALSRQTIGRVETGSNWPSARTQAMLATALGITIGQLHEGPPAEGTLCEPAPGAYGTRVPGVTIDTRSPRPVELPYYEQVPSEGWRDDLSRPDATYHVLHPRARRRTTVVLRIAGDLMYPTLHEGDLVLVNTAARRPRSGDIVVVSASGFTGVARYRMIHRRRHLAGDNPSFPPIPFANLDTPVFLGIVAALIRRDLT
jgi:transcriptional regulator with XRE-family HTH domain